MILLANSIALLHGLIVVPLLILGPIALLLLKKRIVWLERIFIIFGVITALSFLLTGACFLTTWEQNLRAAAGEPSYTQGFISHYLGEIGIKFPDLAAFITLTLAIIIGFWRILSLRKKD